MRHSLTTSSRCIASVLLARQAWSAQRTTIEEAGARSCRVSLSGEVSVPVPGLGPLSERIVVSTVVAAMRQLPYIVCARA